MTALAILAMLPFTVGAWALTLTLPIAYQAWSAADKIFVTRVEDPYSGVEGAPTAAGEMPESVSAMLTATAGGPPLDASATPEGTQPSGLAGGAGALATPEQTPTPRASSDRFSDDAPAGPTPTASPTPYPEWNGEDPIHILLLGVDTRPSETTAGRSDSIIVVRIDPEEKRVDMFSIPRDLAVDIPGFSDGVKVNSAFPWGESYDVPGGGPTLVAQTIWHNFGVRIDYFATVDIPGLEEIVDAIGGVVVDVKAPLKDDQYPTDDYGYQRIYFPAGLQKLNGEEAVQYARTRHADNDFFRSERQQEVLLAIREQAIEGGLITRLPELIARVGDAVRTDLSPSQVYSLARLAQDIDREDIWVHSLTPYMTSSNTSEGYFLLGDWEALRWITQHLPDDPMATNNPGE